MTDISEIKHLLFTYVLQCNACKVVILDTDFMHFLYRNNIQHCITCGGYKFTLRRSDGNEELIDTTPKEKTND